MINLRYSFIGLLSLVLIIVYGNTAFSDYKTGTKQNIIHHETGMNTSMLHFDLGKLPKHSPIIAILPHFMFETSKTDTFYKSIAQQRTGFNKVILISPNHFRAGVKPFESIPNNIQKLCFRSFCAPVLSLATGGLVGQGIFPDNAYTKQSTRTDNASYYVNDHGLGEHFQFIQKHFSGTIVHPILVDLYNAQGIDQVILYLSGMIDNQTLVVFSVDFSHHNNTLFAKLHDQKTQYTLGNSLKLQDFMETEVDCRSCLYISKIIGNYWGLAPKLIDRDDQCSFIGNRKCSDNTSRDFYLYTTGFVIPSGQVNLDLGKIQTNYPDLQLFTQSLSGYFQKSDVTLNPRFNYHRTLFGLDKVVATISRSTPKSFRNLLKSLGVTHFKIGF